MLAKQTGISLKDGESIIAQMRLDQARCAMKSWSPAPDQYEALVLQKIAVGELVPGNGDDVAMAFAKVLKDEARIPTSEIAAMLRQAEALYKNCDLAAEKAFTNRVTAAQKR